MSPMVQGDTLVYRQGEQEYELVVDTLAWFAWLETASTFSFVSEAGSFTARLEQSGHKRGGWYWKAYRKQRGKLSSRYLGKSETLTLERLQAVAQALADAPIETSHINDAKTAVSPAPRAAQSTHSDPFSPLLSTKLHIPLPHAKLIRRSHLDERLAQGMASAITLISAPAGFGKTTLLAQWIAESDTPVAWLSLELEDNEPVRFLSYLIAALQTHDPGIGMTALSLLRTPQPAELQTVLTVLTNDLASRGVGNFALVLDDYHVITAEPLHRVLAYLVEHLPPSVHLMIVTRADPPLPLSRLRARGQLCELRVAELRFAMEEASTFLRTVMGLDLSTEAIATLQSRTEGWITGLQLAALSLRDRSDVSAFLAAFTGSHRYVLDYLSEEVFARQDTVVQQFLLHTSILERLSASLCQAVTGYSDSQAMLEAIEDANLFVVALDDERSWYRYHHLFAEVLRNHLRQAEPMLVAELHHRASVWYERSGLVDGAVEHALASQDVERAARLIEANGLSIGLQGQVGTVFSWLERLPETLVRGHPSLCLLYATMMLFTNRLEETEAYLQDAEAALQLDLPAEQKQLFRGQIATIRANVLHYSGDVVQSVALARQALDVLPETETFARAAALLLAASAYLISGDVTNETAHLLMEVARPVRASGNAFAAFSSFTLLARMYLLQGQLRQAANMYEEALQGAPSEEVFQALVGRPAYFIGLADLLREWNDLDEAERHLTQWMDLMKGTAAVDADVITWGHTTLARLHMARGDYRETCATLDALTQLAHQRHFASHLMSYGLAVRAQIELAQGNLAASLRWAGTSGLFLSDEYPGYLQERAYLTLARVHIAQGRVERAWPFLSATLDLLARLLEDAQAKARMSSVLEILILRALAFDAGGNRTEALTTLEHALLLAEPEGYIRLFIDEGAPMVTLLLQAHTLSIAPSYIAQLLAVCGVHVEIVPPQSSLLIEPLTEREIEVLRLLVAGLSNRAIAQELIITIGTVKRHINSIYGKLGVNSRTQAIACARSLHVL